MTLVNLIRMVNAIRVNHRYRRLRPRTACITFFIVYGDSLTMESEHHSQLQSTLDTLETLYKL
jgi:hypothetical protein